MKRFALVFSRFQSILVPRALSFCEGPRRLRETKELWGREWLSVALYWCPVLSRLFLSIERLRNILRSASTIDGSDTYYGTSYGTILFLFEMHALSK